MILSLGLIFAERMWSLELRELNDALCMVAQRDDFYADAAHRPFLEIDILNRLTMSKPSDILVRVDALDSNASWTSNNWSNELRLDQMIWHQEDMSDIYLQYQEVLSKRPNAPNVCDQAHIQYSSTDWHLVKVKHQQGTVYLAARLDALSFRLFAFFSPSVVPVGLFLMALLVICVYWLSRFISAPIKQLSHAMHYASDNIDGPEVNLDTSIPELKELVGNYKKLLTRVRQNIVQAQRFSADAAHELKTPLTVLQGRLEAALTDTKDIQVQQVLAGLQAEVSHLTSITRKLLLLSQADAGNLALDKKQFDWSELLTTAINDSGELFTSNPVHASIGQALSVSGDACLLMRLNNNLLTNISKYALPDSPIHISSQRVNGMVETRFRNIANPLPTEQRAHLFDRFYRVGSEVLGANAGVGLGLSLSREIARAHGGDLVLENTAADIFEFKLTLPAA
jgi:hypothetical protein